MNRYEMLSINDIRGICDRFRAALSNPRLANRDQVLSWYEAAVSAYRAAMGLAA